MRVRKPMSDGTDPSCGNTRKGYTVVLYTYPVGVPIQEEDT